MFNSNWKRRIPSGVLQVGSLLVLFSSAVSAQDASLRNSHMSVTVHSGDGSYSIQAVGSQHPAIQAIVAAEVDHRWIKSSDFPTHQISESKFEDALGPGHQITVTSTGMKNSASLTYVVRLYDVKPYGDIEVKVRNEGSKTVEIQTIRSVEAIGNQPIRLGENESSDRILSDSFSEDWPPLQIYDLGKAPQGMHRAVGSQLIYNRESKESVFFGALTSNRFLTIIHLQTQSSSSDAPGVVSYTVDSTGTTEIQATDPESGLREGSPENLIELSVPLFAGESVASERVMFAAGKDYYSQLDNYCLLYTSHVTIGVETSS